MKSNRLIRVFAVIAAALWLTAFTARATAALQSDEILLVTNKNSPDSQKLAELYCQLRGVPSAQIVALDLPNEEEMAFSTYETGVVAPVREFLEDHQLQTKVKCLLTFYGVPFRNRAKVNTFDEQHELAEMQRLQWSLTDQLKQTVGRIETEAGGLDPSFQPGVGDSVRALLARAQAGLSAIGPKIPGIADETARNQQLGQWLSGLETIGGKAEIDARMGVAERGDPSKTDDQRRYWIDLHQRVVAARAQVQQLQALRWDSQARAGLRAVCAANFGVIGTLRVLEMQINYLTTGTTPSATDNELTLLWEDNYPRQRGLNNPLNLQYRNSATHTLMVMRLDGPDPATVRRMMQTSVEVEKRGLRGIVAIDARGLTPIDDKGKPSAYGEFDQTLRDLAQLIRLKTDLTIRLDDQDIVFPPHSVKNVALYCGWYSVGHYIPGCDFNAGAVGYHIASFEMVSLHEPSSYWVRGLLSDGVVATLGPVAEPTLDAFPRPDEFFPLLLTGKLTLAEVYWKTTPMTGWMINVIGDPLYCPYKANPALQVEDLPPRAALAFRGQESATLNGATDSSHTSN
ncbi:MAG: TIGR03790 family protein [Tepidisphaeraceae bacterium]